MSSQKELTTDANREGVVNPQKSTRSTEECKNTSASKPTKRPADKGSNASAPKGRSGCSAKTPRKGPILKGDAKGQTIDTPVPKIDAGTSVETLAVIATRESAKRFVNLGVSYFPDKDAILLIKEKYYFSPDMTRDDCAKVTANLVTFLSTLNDFEKSYYMSGLPIMSWDPFNKEYINVSDTKDPAQAIRALLLDIHTSLQPNILVDDAIKYYSAQGLDVIIGIIKNATSAHALVPLQSYDPELRFAIKKDGQQYIRYPALSFGGFTLGQMFDYCADKQIIFDDKDLYAYPICFLRTQKPLVLPPVVQVPVPSIALSAPKLSKDTVDSLVSALDSPLLSVPLARVASTPSPVLAPPRISFDLPLWTEHFEYCTTDEIMVNYESNSKNTHHDLFKYARSKLIYVATDDWCLNYCGESPKWYAKLGLTSGGKSLYEFCLPQVKNAWTILLVVPMRPGVYPLFSGEGTVERLQDNSLVLQLRGMKSLFQQVPLKIHTLDYNLPTQEGSLRMVDNMRVGCDVFLGLYQYTKIPLCPTTDLSTLQTVGMIYGQTALTNLYRSDVKAIQQWISSGLNRETFMKGPQKCSKQIACYFSALYGVSNTLRDGAEDPTFRVLIDYVAHKEINPENDRLIEHEAMRNTENLTKAIITGQAMVRGQLVELKNERINKGKWLPSRIIERLSLSWRRFIRTDATKTLVRDKTHVVSRRTVPVAPKAEHESTLISTYKILPDHFSDTMSLSSKPLEISISSELSPISEEDDENIPLCGTATRLARRARVHGKAVYQQYADTIAAANKIKVKRSDYQLFVGAHRPEAMIVPLTREQQAQRGVNTGYGLQGKFVHRPALSNPRPIQDMVPYYFPLIPARAPNHGTDELLWALEVRQLRPMAIPEIEDPLWKELESYVDKIKLNVPDIPIVSFHQYLETVEGPKRKSYLQGYNNFMSNGKCPITYTLLAKPYENQYKGEDNENKLKPRLIFNPSFQLKAFGGWISHLLTIYCKRLFPGICLSQTPGGMKRRIIRQMKKFANPISIMWDGARHDAHQSRKLLETIDLILLTRIFDIVGPLNGFNPHMMAVGRLIIAQMVAQFHVKARTPGNRDRNIEPMLVFGTIDGSVFSGHPLRTSLGNSMRIAVIISFVMTLAGIVLHTENQSGDDTHVIIENIDFSKFFSAFGRVYGEEGKRSTFGLIYSDLFVSTDKLEFLGKEGRIFGKGVLMDLERPIGKIHTFAWYYEHIKDADRVGQGIRDYIHRNYSRKTYEDIIQRYPTSNRPIELKWCQYEFDAEEKNPEIPVVEEHIPFLPLAGTPSQSKRQSGSDTKMPKRSGSRNQNSNPSRSIPATKKKQIKREVKRELKIEGVLPPRSAPKPRSQPHLRRSTRRNGMLTEIGGIAGGLVGMPSLGRKIGSGLGRIFGRGDYTVKSNSLLSGGPPAFASVNTGTRIAHREYIQDVSSSIDFQNTTFDVNPANALTFPWLSRFAQNYEKYEIRGIAFHFNTTCGDAISSTNNALGTVGMVTVYDPSDAPLASKREAEDYVGCVAGVPSVSLLHPIECKPKSNVLDRQFVLTGSLTSAEDKKFYSHGTLNLFTQGMQQAGVTIGELWVTYDVDFFDPKILPNGTTNQAASKYYAVNSTTTATQVLGTSDLTFVGNLGVTYRGADGTIVIPSGTAAGLYFFNLMAVGASVTGTHSLTSWSTNLTPMNYLQGNSSSNIYAPNAAVSNPFHGFSFYLNKTDSLRATVNLTWLGTVPTGLWGTDILVTRIPGSAVGLLQQTDRKRKILDPIVLQTLEELGFVRDRKVVAPLEDSLSCIDEESLYTAT